MPMAQSLKIVAEENATHVIVDGNEINDVVAYQLTEDHKAAYLTLKIFISGSMEVNLNNKLERTQECDVDQVSCKIFQAILDGSKKECVRNVDTNAVQD